MRLGSDHSTGDLHRPSKPVGPETAIGSLNLRIEEFSKLCTVACTGSPVHIPKSCGRHDVDADAQSG